MKLRFVMAAILAGLSAMGQPVFSLRSMQVSPRPEIVASKPDGRAAELLIQLASDSPEQRRAAFRSPLKIGSTIEPQVRWAFQHEEPALTFPYLPVAANSNLFILDPRLLAPHHALHALEALLSHFEEQRQLPSSIITLHYTNAPLTNVLADFGAQASAEISLGSFYPESLDWIRTNRLTVDVNRVTYWEALECIEQAGELRQVVENPNRLYLIQRARGGLASEPPGTNGSVVSGPLKITPIFAELSRTLNYQDGRSAARVKLTLHAQAEPKFWNTGMNALVQVDECVDAYGQSLLEQSGRTFPTVEEHPRYSSWEVPVELKAPGTGGRIQRLKGRFNVELTTAQRYLSITNLMSAHGQSREYGDLAVTVSQINAEPDYNEIQVEVSAPAESPFARTFADSRDCCNLSVFDESGREIRVAYLPGPWIDAGLALWDGFRGKSTLAAPEAGQKFNEVRHQAGLEVISWKLFFSKRLKPATRWLTVPFELRDLRMPPA